MILEDGQLSEKIRDLLSACRSGAITDLLDLLREDIRLVCDHPEEEGATCHLLVGLGQCSKFLKALCWTADGAIDPIIGRLAGRPVVLLYGPGRSEPAALLFFEQEGDKFGRIHCFRHPANIRRHLYQRNAFDTFPRSFRREGARQRSREATPAKAPGINSASKPADSHRQT